MLGLFLLELFREFFGVSGTVLLLKFCEAIVQLLEKRVQVDFFLLLLE